MVPFFTGLSCGQKELVCPVMQRRPADCLGTMYAACISQRVIS